MTAQLKEETNMHADFEQITGDVSERYGPVRVDTTYSEMVATFGPPNSTDDDTKTDVAWDVLSSAGAVHIYNYKNGPAYEGRGTIAGIRGFSVQGESEAAVAAAVAALAEVYEAGDSK
jgi:hypothetical protein